VPEITLMKNLSRQRARHYGILVVLIAICTLGAATARRWLPILQNRISATGHESHDTTNSADSEQGHSGSKTQQGDHAHGSHGHGGDTHGGHAHGDGQIGASHTDHESNALNLSAEALRNVGLIEEQIRQVELTTFWRTITVPARVVGRTGRTQVQVATPMTGMITHVHATQGEAVAPGTLLFRIQLTHEDLLQLQTEFLQTIGELDVEEREIKRLTEVTRSQAVPGNLLLEREYERDKLTALKNAQRESLRLHGLSEEHIQAILRDRRLIRELDVLAPTVDRHPAGEHQYEAVRYRSGNAVDRQQPASTGSLLVLEDLKVHKGQVVPAGMTLCVLKDYSELFIEGLAFEKDLPTLRTALREKQDVTAVFEEAGANPRVVRGLQIEHLANEVDSDSRSIQFFVRLPNRISGEHRRGHARFVHWVWMIGQRAQLRVPFGRWKNQIVLPRQAVAEEGSKNYVFRRHAGHFDRVAIRVRHRDPLFVVVERDGAISPGNRIAWQGALEMQLALRRQSSGPVGAHHGHTH